MLRENTERDGHTEAHVERHKSERNTASEGDWVSNRERLRERQRHEGGRKKEADRCTDRPTNQPTDQVSCSFCLSFPLLVWLQYNTSFHVSHKSKWMMNKEVTASILPPGFLCYRGELRKRGWYPQPTQYHESSERLAICWSRSRLSWHSLRHPSKRTE